MSTAARTGTLFAPDEALTVECQECTATLELHQPDVDEPGALIGLCPDCGLLHTLSLREVILVEVTAAAHMTTALRESA